MSSPTRSAGNPTRRAGRAASYAKRFAAKEACAKALGTGFRKGVFWRDMGVVNLRSGRPTMVLTGGAAEQLRRITPQGFEARVDLSLTDDFPLAQAIVVISAVPARAGSAREAWRRVIVPHARRSIAALPLTRYTGARIGCWLGRSAAGCSAKTERA